MSGMMTPAQLEIELFCRGLRIAPGCDPTDGGRRIARTRAGLGSGLELILPRSPKPIWVNVPIVEPFARRSPLELRSDDDGFLIIDSRDGEAYPVTVPAEPAWYSRKTSSGVPMSRIGVLQGNYLGIYVSNRCMYWSLSPAAACKFCTTGKNVGSVEEARKSAADVVEVARAAQRESGSIFTHLNTGYHFEDSDSRAIIHGLRQCAPFVRALREEVGGFIGVQACPVPASRLGEYDRLIDIGADHFSFCYEFEDPEYFARLCPGKAQTLGQKAFFDAMEYTAKKLGKGRVSGEIIAGVEPIAATKRGIDRIVSAGAFPTVCIFRPTIGSEMEGYPAPEPEEMREVFAYMYEACRREGIPIGVLPIEVSLVVQPEESGDLVPATLGTAMYNLRNRALSMLARPYVRWKLKPRSAPAIGGGTHGTPHAA